jgi:WD40 repeat protein
MTHPLSIRRGALGTIAVLVAVLSTTAAWAVTPTVVWQQTGTTSHIFSTDGTAVLMGISTGFELRRASDGLLLNTVTLPTGSSVYKAHALSPDKQRIATVLTNRSIEIWNVSNSTRLRTITTDAVRDIKWVALSNTFVASMERFGYGDGGKLRVYNTSTGVLVKNVLAIRNSSPVAMDFSPNGQYLAYPDHFSVGGFVLLRTSDWTTALAVPGSVRFYSWVPDSASLWNSSSQRIRIPDGAVLQTVPAHPQSVLAGYAPNNQSFLANVFVDTQFSNQIQFVRTSNSSVQVTYTFPGVTSAYADEINSLGTLFTYTLCPSACTSYIAAMPAL